MNNLFEQIISALSRPEFFPHKPAAVQVIQTHISVIFIAGEDVYKIKKPVNFGFLDFTSLEKRRYYCHQEVTLNSRFSENIYRGVVSIHRQEGMFNLAGRGEEVEVAVLMRKIPHDRIMINMLGEDLITLEMLDQLADQLTLFHRRAKTSPEISGYGSVPVIYQNLRENFLQTERFIPRTLSRECHQDISELSFDFLLTHSDLFTKRVQDGFIRDCHGDLHLDHVVFLDKIMLFDCIEFNDRFRFGDTASDLSFLLMDLDYRAYPGFSRRIEERYAASSSDQDILKLLPFYKSYRAFVRGKVHSFTLDEPEVSPAEQSTHAKRAVDYFKLSLTYLKPKPPPVLVITSGLTGTGKSYLASLLGKRLGIGVIRSDIIRKHICGIAPSEQRLDNYGTGIYTPSTTERTYDAMFAKAKESLRRGDSVILDASFLKLSHRQQAAAMAKGSNASFVIVECIAPQDVVRQRLEQRVKERIDPSDGRWDIYLQQEQAFDSFQAEEISHLRRWRSVENPNDFLDTLVKELII